MPETITGLAIEVDGSCPSQQQPVDNLVYTICMTVSNLNLVLLGNEGKTSL